MGIALISYRKTLIKVLKVVLIMFTVILVASPELGDACRPLSLQDDQWSRKLYGLLLPSVIRGPAPPSGPDPIHPRLA